MSGPFYTGTKTHSIQAVHSSDQTASVRLTSLGKHASPHWQRRSWQCVSAHRSGHTVVGKPQEKEDVSLEKGSYFFGILNCCRMSVLFFFKNGYPSKERASKDTPLQVTKREVGIKNTCLFISWFLPRPSNLCQGWGAWNGHLVFKWQSLMMSSSLSLLFICGRPHSISFICWKRRQS